MKRILRAIFLLIFFLSSCNGNGTVDLDSALNVRIFSASGILTDSESGEPIEDITVTLTAYNLADPQKKMPLYEKSYNTLSDGVYRFIIINESVVRSIFYEFRLVDNSSRSPRYASVVQDLFMSSSSSYYDAVFQKYEVSNNDFVLKKAARK